MSEIKIEGIVLGTVTRRYGLLGRKSQHLEQLCMKTPKGHIYLDEGAFEGSGDSWRLFKARLRENAEKHGIPLEDHREA